MNIGFIGLGNVGGKLAGSLLRNGIDLTVRDLHRNAAQPFLSAGAGWGESPANVMEAADAVITCLPKNGRPISFAASRTPPACRLSLRNFRLE